MAPRLSRREFLVTTAAVGAASTLTLGCPDRFATGPVIVFRRSGRGRRVSNSAKRYNANKLFRTRDIALNRPAHPGDTSKVVMVTVSGDFYNRTFARGMTEIDLRDAL